MSWGTPIEPGSKNLYASGRSNPTSSTTTTNTGTPRSTSPSTFATVSTYGGGSGSGSGGSSLQSRDNTDMNVVTKRMVKMASNANDIADETLKKLDEQNEEIKRQQDQTAEMADEINVATRKIKGIRSIFNHIGNQFKKDNKEEHRKARQDYEKERAKNEFKKEEEKQKIEEKELDGKIEITNMQLKLAAQKDTEKLNQAKAQSHQDIKSAKRNPALSGNPGDAVVMGKFVFEERDVPGEQCEAENNLDDVEKHVKMLKNKAMQMGDSVEESNQRISDLHRDLNDVQTRTIQATKKEEKIIKGW